ncbi:MAG: hypothetical protein EOP60_11465 [Sphingomonadales bacterium]|nr:MAG: hypothetical protein EOP60_11465 [Sphingomonadales bacterium]
MIKMLAFGSGGVMVAGMFGLSLASFAESGSFEFYKRQPYSSGYVAQNAPLAEPASYSISPPAASASPVEMIAAPRAQYSPGYPGDGWAEDAPAGPSQAVAYEVVAEDDGPDARVVPETGGSWTEPAREVRVVRADAEDVVYIEATSDDGDASEGRLEETD